MPPKVQKRKRNVLSLDEEREIIEKKNLKGDAVPTWDRLRWVGQTGKKSNTQAQTRILSALKPSTGLVQHSKYTCIYTENDFTP